MSKVVKVTPAQVAAAKLKIKLSAAAGKPVDPRVYRIAEARRSSESKTERPST
jgi:hypothetical protein